jgi:hypothetical protein
MNFQKEFDIHSLIHEPFGFTDSRELEESPWLSEISGSSPELSSVQPTPHLVPMDSIFNDFGLGINDYPALLPHYHVPKPVLPPIVNMNQYDLSRIIGNHPRLETARDLLSRTTEEECHKILETPIQRKPGRPSKNPYFGNEQVYVSNIVDDGTMDKLTIRKLKNRESADHSRKRRQERMKKMEMFTSRLKAENYQLQELIKALENGEL